MNSDKQKNSKRYLSPSFKKGALNSKEQEKGKEEFKISLIVASNIDDDEETCPSDKNNTASPQKMPSNKEMIQSTGCIKNQACHSQAGKAEDGTIKINQDSYVSLPSMFNLSNFNIYGVLDGHGVHGHLISKFVTKYIHSSIAKNKKLNTLQTEEEIYKQLKRNEYDIIARCFWSAEREIAKGDIDAKFSGTTSVTVFQIGARLICANIGDSRCIVVTEDNTIQLSIDQKPELPEEKKRIIKSGGEVEQYDEEGVKMGPYRVWKKGHQYPGLAMSRSIGDLIASTIGVIPEPEITELTIDDKTQFLIIASDGLWEFLDNDTVREIVMPFYKKNDPDGACKELIRISTQWWEQEDVVIDDITVVALFF